MLNHAYEPVIDHSWIPSSAWRCLQFPERNQVAQKNADLLDEVPVMSATVLGLEMLLYEPCIDLRMASELILSDVGATIKILRLIGKEYEFAAERPSRMGDCLASLDVEVWFGAIASQTFVCDREHAAIDRGLESLPTGSTILTTCGRVDRGHFAGGCVSGGIASWHRRGSQGAGLANRRTGDKRPRRAV